MYKQVSILLMVAVLAVPLGMASPATIAASEGPPIGAGEGSTIRVTTFEDAIKPDGNCSLREAIRTANLNDWVDACELGSGHDTILVPEGTYMLSVRCEGADDDYCGDLDILDHVSIVGQRAGSTIIDAGRIDRVVQVHTGRTVDIAGLTMRAGRVQGQNGGGILNSGTLTLQGVVLRDNLAAGSLDAGGGGLANIAAGSNAIATLRGCRVAGNSATGGGGILNAAESPFVAKVRLEESTVDGNWASYAGGGILQARGSGYGGGRASLVVDRSTVSRNAVSSGAAGAGNGGGIAVLGGFATLVNSTVSTNTAWGSGAAQLSGLGGGIYVANLDSSPDVTLLNVTLADSRSSSGGPAVTAANLGESQAGLAMSFKNTIIAASSSELEDASNCLVLDWGVGEVRFTSLGHNMEDADSCRFGQTTDWVHRDPLLAPLGYHGGSTEVHLLRGGSPAVDNGDDGACPPIDQRGVPRPQGRQSDIGAVEVRLVLPGEPEP